MLSIRRMTQEDWPLVEAMFKEKGLVIYRSDFPDTTSYVVEDRKGLIAAGCLILTNANFTIMEHLQTSPKRSQALQSRALRALALYIENLSKSTGAKFILGFVPEDHFSLAKFYLRQGAAAYQKLFRVFSKRLLGEE